MGIGIYGSVRTLVETIIIRAGIAWEIFIQ